MRTCRIVFILIPVILLATSCQPIAGTPPATATVNPPTTVAPTDNPPPPSTETPAPTVMSSPTLAPSPVPTAEKTEPWLPALPEEPCTPSAARTCRVLFVLPAQYYAESGRSFPDQFREAGYEVTIASEAPQVVEVCANTIRAAQPNKNIPVDLSLAEVQVAEYDAFVFIGGLGCEDQWHDAQAHRIAQQSVDQGQVVGAAGCASTILAHAGVLQGKTAVVCSGNPPVKHGQDYCAVLQSQGAICSNAQIVRDGVIVTARQYSPYFVAGVIQVIVERK